MLKFFRNEKSPMVEIIAPSNISKGGMKIGTLSNVASGENTNRCGKNEPSKEINVGPILEYFLFGLFAISKMYEATVR